VEYFTGFELRMICQDNSKWWVEIWAWMGLYDIILVLPVLLRYSIVASWFFFFLCVARVVIKLCRGTEVCCLDRALFRLSRE